MRKLGLFGTSVSAGYSARFGLIALALCSAELSACKKKPPVPVAEPDLASDMPADVPESALSGTSPRPAPPSAGPVPARCRELAQGAPFRIGDLSASHAPADDAEDAGPDDDD